MDASFVAPGQILNPFPPGTLGEAAQFIYDAAPRPVAEIALAGAVGFLAGICGRAYNISGAGLNQYLIVVSQSGRGKEAIASGISKLVTSLATTTPIILEFVGPTEIASAQALLKWIARQSSVFSILGEFGHTLKSMSNPNASVHISGQLRVLLHLYAKSGKGNSLGAMAYSEREKNVAPIISPSFTLIGETTPQILFENIEEDLISCGLLPRFMFFEYDGPRVPRNDRHNCIAPSDGLLSKLSELTAHVCSLNSRGYTCDVGTSPSAKAIFDEFDHLCDTHINRDSSSQVAIELWNRAHLKALKLSALIAVGMNYHSPVIDDPIARSTVHLVSQQTISLIRKFANGETGAIETNEALRRKAVLKVIGQYCQTPFEQLPKYGVLEDIHRHRVVTQSYLLRRLGDTAAFRKAPGGATRALAAVLNNMILADELREISRIQMVQTFGTTARAFGITNSEPFLDAV